MTPITKRREMTQFVYSRSVINQFCDHFAQNTLNVTNKLAYFCLLTLKHAGFTSTNFSLFYFPFLQRTVC